MTSRAGNWDANCFMYFFFVASKIYSGCKRFLLNLKDLSSNIFFQSWKQNNPLKLPPPSPILENCSLKRAYPFLLGYIQLSTRYVFLFFPVYTSLVFLKYFSRCCRLCDNVWINFPFLSLACGSFWQGAGAISASIMGYVMN